MPTYNVALKPHIDHVNQAFSCGVVTLPVTTWPKPQSHHLPTANPPPQWSPRSMKPLLSNTLIALTLLSTLPIWAQAPSNKNEFTALLKQG
ncbi:MAG: hypothetical protein JNM52_01990, partial [Betaproteobacteria bacterium]|nr:hypothetical protein [Betaproteobacteria bacterium]